MRKKLSLLLTIALIATSFIPVYAANITIDNQDVQFTDVSGMPFIDEANRTQVPFRQTMEQFGCKVGWDNETKTAIAEKNGIIVKVPIGEKFIIKDGTILANDTAALIKDSRTYLPIRSVLEAFGAEVSWDGRTQTVLVYSDSQGQIMTVHFIDVGQADSIFIDYGEYEILIDGGNSWDGKLVVDYIAPYVDGNLELVIATHVHADHIGGLTDVINAYQVDKIIHSEESGTTATYSNFFNAATSDPNCEYVGDSDMIIDLGNGAQFKVFEMGDGYSNSNNNSVITMMDYKNVQILFMGDLESDVEKKNLGKFSKIDVLKAGHHGSDTSSCSEFLDITSPQTVIISAGLDNRYKHPNIAAIERFQNAGSDIYGTFKSGTIVLNTNGNTYSLNTSTKVTSADAGDRNTLITQPVQPPTPPSYIDKGKVIESEAAYIGNSNSKKFHKLSCKYANKISHGNIIYFKTRDNATGAGYVPCKVCHP